MTLNTPLLLYCLIFCSAFLGFQFVVGTARQVTVGVKHANARLKEKANTDTPEDLLAKMRKDRGLSDEGFLKALNYRIGKMVLQSGLPLGQYRVYGIIIASLLIGGVAAWSVKGTIIWTGGGMVVGVLTPLLFLHFVVKRRRAKAVAQLPEALDVIVRSLKAGHPVSVAMGLVGREMPDPIGSEFGIASDEVSYGSQVSAAIQRLSERIGQEDFELFAAMIRLQERTGGNLAELLQASAGTIRDRQKMRLKIKAASAEGRASAMILNAAPVCLFLLIKATSPEFYGDIDDNDIVKYGLWGAAVWMLIGNLVMRRMINFRI